MTGFRAEMVGRMTVIGKREGGFHLTKWQENLLPKLERLGLKEEKVYFLKRRNSKIGREAPLVWYVI